MSFSDTGMWQIWADTGGTFTDCIAVAPDGTERRVKVLSSSALRGTVLHQITSDTLRVQENWSAPTNFPVGFTFHRLGPYDREMAPAIVTAYDPVRQLLVLSDPVNVSAPSAFELRSHEEAPLLAARLVTGTPADAPLPPLALRLATTRGTNALLTRSGTSPAFFVTRGFADLLAIGTQQRPDLFALDIVKPAPLYGPVIEVEERLNADGSVLRPLDEEQVRTEIARLIAGGVTTAAVAFLHSSTNPEHERRVRELLRAAGFTHISLSSDLAPFVKILPRAETAVVNAYLAPVIGGYVGRVQAGSGTGREETETSRATLHLMTSAGGLVSAAGFKPKDSLLSGPAGGIVGAALAGRRAGFDRVIAFDMGGTSTDVARYDGDFEYTFEHQVGDAHLVAPALAIESVAAGGGSVCVADRQGLRVGPESAGAHPGPACYGAAGPLTITDVNLLLGRILPDRFEIPLQRERAEEAAEHLMIGLAQETGTVVERDSILEGLLEIANERMADAIRRISVRKGYDPSEYALVSFGGAGGQHACAVASRLGIRTVIVPRDASLLSAWGIGQAVMERFAERQVLRGLSEYGEETVAALLDTLIAEAREALAAEGIPSERAIVRRRIVALRLLGQESSLPLEYDPALALAEAFSRRYEAVYGHRPPENRSIEIESVRVVVSELERSVSESPRIETAPTTPGEAARVESRFQGEWVDTAVYERENIPGDTAISGPALIVERHSVIVVEPEWTATVDRYSGAVALSHTSLPPTREVIGGAERIQTELYASRFTAITEEMGEMLQRTALSVNVKERLDFSCALLNRSGDLIASAAHIPVHLGALGACVRRLRETVTMGPFDTVVVNHPAFGGSHLPDVTVVTPVFDAGQRLLGYVANRAHHAEIGGTRPGSMPPDATTLAEEGVVLPPTFLTKYDGAGGTTSRLDAVCQLLAEAPYPSRAIDDNRADLEAALAANRRGADALRMLATNHGADAMERYMDALTARAERLLRHALSAKPDGAYSATEHLDDGTPIVVTVTITGDAATIDFTGTGPTHPGNLNAPPAVVRSAILYIQRLLVGEPIPLNEGLLRPVRLILPENTLVNPTFDPRDPANCPAVVGGNTETSQRIVGTLLKALELGASSQGTMNNVLFGNANFGYYETICGGAGATKNAPGASAVHTHMTNTRITDVEILERRYPVRVERFGIRRGSGGAGHHPGGDGAIREFTFLASVSLSILTQHRVCGPFGLAGGEPGQPGRQTLFRATGEIEELPSIGGAEVRPGDRLLLETPGGGGWGDASEGIRTAAVVS